MAYTALTTAEIQVKQPIKQGLMQKIKDNFDSIYASVASGAGGGVPNGDFEIDSDSNGTPDTWTISTYAGGTGALDTASPASGSKCLKFVHPGGAGNGGGYADSDYIPFHRQGYITVWQKATAACKNQVAIRYYDKAKAFISETTLDSRVDTPTGWMLLWGCFSLESTTACYIKVRLIGGYTDTNVAGSIYFDNVRVYTAPQTKFFFPYVFADTTFSGSSFADVITQTVNIPVMMTGNIPGTYTGVQLTMVVEAYNSASYDVHLRLRVDGALYGTDITLSAPASWTLATLTLDTAGSSAAYGGAMSVIVQGYRVSSGTAHVRKLNTLFTLEIMNR